MTVAGEAGLSGRIALVTAGSDGLGLACSIRLARAGCKIAICGRDPGKLASAKSAIEAAGCEAPLAIECDLSDGVAVSHLVPIVTRHFGGLGILVLNSGHIPYGDLESLTDAHWQEAFDLLLMSVVRLSRAALQPMRQAGQGDIVFLTSASLQSAAPHLLLSSVFRLGVAALAKTLSHVVAGDGIRVNTIAPGFFDTGRVRKRIDAVADEKGIDRARATREIVGEMPMGRIGHAAELAEMVAFIAGSSARFLHGATIAMDGGKGRHVL